MRTWRLELNMIRITIKSGVSARELGLKALASKLSAMGLALQIYWQRKLQLDAILQEVEVEMGMPHFQLSLLAGNLILPWPHQDESLETQLRIASPYNSAHTSEDSDSRGEREKRRRICHQEIDPQNGPIC